MVVPAVAGTWLLAAGPSAAPAHAEAPAADEGPRVEWQAPREIATGPAERGPWRMNDSRFLFVDNPTVAFAPDGGLAVAWADQAAQDIYLQRLDADGDASRIRLYLGRPAD